ncbi:alpha/beta fold hydrolase [Paenibacillus alkalitolerans]|uniref:alpha/beta fold hydrolase n=1 Tax=Paenibacillus alkalitolerans TaxID=2799335 RepID=UPI0018F74171|nr:alpha/beta hydrolase [Paenibacillus alkalitolerans]
MNEYNVYGRKEVSLVLVHGGPGARGSLKDLAVMLSKDLGILEINQSKLSIKELIEDMNKYITKTCKNKVALLGHSWGAWLVCLYAHNYPDKVEKIILVGSGSFDTRYVKEFSDRRLSRLSKDEKSEYDLLMKDFISNDLSNKDEVMFKFGKLMAKIDTYEFVGNEYSTIGEASFQMFNSIWNEASNLRKTGELMNIMKEIDVPIHVIHGDYDSHEIKGVLEPFEEYGIQCTYDVIKRCGHYPWREKYGKNEFLDIIIKEVNQ